MKTVLTIAGSDCSGGAGIQADIKTIAAHKLYAMSAIAALTAQNTTGVYGVAETAPDFVALQLDLIFTDIPPDSVKTGMLSSGQLIGVVAQKLKAHGAPNLVVDPVMVSTSGCQLMDGGAMDALMNQLAPLARVVTPNLQEAQRMSAMVVQTPSDMERAARAIGEQLGTAVLVKGGHLAGDAADVLYEGGALTWFSAPRVDTQNTHGTGCTLSSAIACGLASGLSLADSIRSAKAYLTGALRAGLNLGHGRGPLDHTWMICPNATENSTICVK